MHDLVIIGGGPGGLTAGIYAVRFGLKTILLEKEMVGGQIALSDVIENYPGFPSISGSGLMEKFEEHAKGLGLEIKFADVLDVVADGDVRIVKTTEGDWATRAVIIATGAKPKRLGAPGEKEYTGKGVSYCATCDGPFFKKLKVMVVGGGDTALKEAHYLSKIASTVYLVHRRDKFRGEKLLETRLEAAPNVVFMKSHVLKEIKGDKIVKSAVLRDLKAAPEAADKELEVDGIFIFVGINPTTDFIDVEKDQGGFIKTDQEMKTSVPGIFAVGDCRTTPLKQVATAVGDGAVGAFVAEAYIDALKSGGH